MAFESAAGPRRGLLTTSDRGVDRAADRRTDPDLIAGLLAEDRTRVLPLVDGRLPVAADVGRIRLRSLSGREVGAVSTEPPAMIFLGEDAGAAHLAAAWPTSETVSTVEALIDEPVRWVGLREVGAVLDDRDLSLMTTAVALANWHSTHPHCARCGAPTVIEQAGWTRRCPVCDTEHFPRTDPAVIMSVVDRDDRLLLGRQPVWPALRFSTLAGYVEPGESLEAAVRREVAEEVGVVVGDVEYVASQPWPFPASLMLAFRARAVDPTITVDGVEITEAAWWTREGLAVDVAAGRLLLPSTISVARRLIEDWYGALIDEGPRPTGG